MISLQLFLHSSSGEHAKHWRTKREHFKCSRHQTVSDEHESGRRATAEPAELSVRWCLCRGPEWGRVLRTEATNRRRVRTYRGFSRRPSVAIIIPCWRVPLSEQLFAVCVFSSLSTVAFAGTTQTFEHSLGLPFFVWNSPFSGRRIRRLR